MMHCFTAVILALLVQALEIAIEEWLPYTTIQQLHTNNVYNSVPFLLAE